MKISFSTVGCPDWSLNEILATAKDLGYDGVEIRGIRGSIYLPKAKEFTDPGLAATLNRLERIGLSVPCLASSCYLHMAGSGEARINEGMEYIDLASKLGSPFVRVLGDTDPEPKATSDCVPHVVEALTALSPYARAKGVKILLETNGYFANSRNMLDLLTKVDNEAVGVLWDIHHPFRYFGESIGDTYSALKNHIQHIHVKDSKVINGALKYTPVGQGDLPVKETIRLLMDQGYTNWISLEWVKRWRPDLEEPGLIFPHFIDFCRRTINN